MLEDYHQLRKMKKNDLVKNAIDDLLDNAENKPAKQDIQDIQDKQYINDIQNIQDIQKKPAEWKKVLLRITPDEYEYISLKSWENHLDITKYLRKLIDDDMKRGQIDEGKNE